MTKRRDLKRVLIGKYSSIYMDDFRRCVRVVVILGFHAVVEVDPNHNITTLFAQEVAKV